MDKKMKGKNLIYNIALIAILSIAVLSIVFKGQDKRDLMEVVSSANNFYLFLGIILSIGFILGEAVNIKMILKIFDYDYSIKKTLKYAFTGFFFSSITPSATGGQPMQVYEMKKDGVEVYHSSLILLLVLMAYQGVTVLYGGIGFIWARYNNFIDSKVVSYMIISGLSLNLLAMCFINLCIFNPAISYKIAKIVEFILNKLPIKEEKKDKIVDNLKEQIVEYNDCAKYIKKDYMILIKVFLVTMFEMGSLFSISYVIYRALGQTGKSLIEVVLIQSLIYIGSSFIPLPGAVGVSESNFLSMFKKIYSEGMLSGALLLSRGISFYLLLIISMVSLAIYKLVDYKKKKFKRLENSYEKII